jgi:arylsulfatase A-like enzyme
VEIFDPHEPFHCTEKYRRMYGDTWDGPLFDWPSYREVSESPAAIEHVRKCYAGLLTMTDHWVGRIFDVLDAQGLWDDTLVILTTDHGTMLAEHQWWMKNYMPLYREIVQIPLILHLPGGEHAGTRVAALTQTIDLMPAILEFHRVPAPPHVHGRSLLPALAGGSLREDGIFGYFGKATNITDGRYVYFRNPVNADAGPLYEYTAMPTRFNRWPDRETFDRIEMGRYFGHTYNLPLYKIPATGQVPQHHPGEASYVARHQLWDLEADPRQEAPIADPAVEARLVARLAAHLKACEAPPEQFTRLGLEPL